MDGGGVPITQSQHNGEKDNVNYNQTLKLTYKTENQLQSYKVKIRIINEV